MGADDEKLLLFLMVPLVTVGVCVCVCVCTMVTVKKRVFENVFSAAECSFRIYYIIIITI